VLYQKLNFIHNDQRAVTSGRAKKAAGKKELLFVNKKKQKNFDNFRLRCFKVFWSKLIKVFWFFFSKKNVLRAFLRAPLRRLLQTSAWVHEK